MEFPARLIRIGGSLATIIPNEVVEAMKLEEGKICKFSVEEANYKDAEKG